MKRINGSLVMGHEDVTGALVELMQIGQTPSGADPVLHHPPKTFHGIEVMAAPGWQEMQPKLFVPVGQRRRQLVGAVDATAVDDHDHLFAGVAKEGHDLMDILTKPLRLKMRDNLIEDFCGAILDGAYDAEQHTTGHTAPTPIAHPLLAFEGLVAFDLARRQGPGGEAIPLGFAPPTSARQGKAPEDGFILIEQNDLITTGLVLQSGEFERGIREGRWLGIKSTGGTTVIDVFFLRPRGRARG